MILILYGWLQLSICNCGENYSLELETLLPSVKVGGQGTILRPRVGCYAAISHSPTQQTPVPKALQ